MQRDLTLDTVNNLIVPTEDFVVSIFGSNMTDDEVRAHYELALKIIEGSTPESDSVEDLKKWYGAVRNIAINALLQNPLDMEFEEALRTSAQSKAKIAGRTLRLK